MGEYNVFPGFQLENPIHHRPKAVEKGSPASSRCYEAQSLCNQPGLKPQTQPYPIASPNPQARPNG
jgi:hypothetical protein